MNKKIDKAEEWISRLKVLYADTNNKDNLEYINEHISLLKWLVKKSKVVESLDKEKEEYKTALNKIAYEDINGWSSMDILEKTADIAHQVLKKYQVK